MLFRRNRAKILKKLYSKLSKNTVHYHKIMKQIDVLPFQVFLVFKPC